MGTPISLRQRIGTSLRDLAGFTPHIWHEGSRLTFVFAIGLVAAALPHLSSPGAAVCSALGLACRGASGLAVFRVDDHFSRPLPTFIGLATREAWGLAVDAGSGRRGSGYMVD